MKTSQRIRILFLIHIKVPYTLNKALTFMLFILFHFLNASHGPLKWFLEKSCPRSIILLLFQFHDYLLSLQLNPLLNLNFNNSLTLSNRHQAPPSHCPVFITLLQQLGFRGPPLHPYLPALPYLQHLLMLYGSYTLLHTCTDAAKQYNYDNFSQFKFTATNFN